MADTSRAGPASFTAAERAQRAERALELRAAGMSLAGIARIIGVSEVTAGKYVARAIKSKDHEGADLLRSIEGARLDALQRAHWPAALQGNVRATRIILSVMQRRARLFGLDAPVVLEVTADVDAQIVALAAQVGLTPDPVVDVVDGSVVTDDDRADAPA